MLMCAPDDFDVRYVINPWMEHQIGRTTHSLAREQWQNLRALVAQSAEIELVPPAAGLPDMVFTANAGFVLGDMAVVSRFRAEERRPEEPLVSRLFRGARVSTRALARDDSLRRRGRRAHRSRRGCRLVRLWHALGRRGAGDAGDASSGGA